MEGELDEKALRIDTLVIDRVTYSTTEPDPIEYVHQLYSANRYQYKVELFRSQQQ